MHTQGRTSCKLTCQLGGTGRSAAAARVLVVLPLVPVCIAAPVTTNLICTVRPLTRFTLLLLLLLLLRLCCPRAASICCRLPRAQQHIQRLDVSVSQRRLVCVHRMQRSTHLQKDVQQRAQLGTLGLTPGLLRLLRCHSPATCCLLLHLLRVLS